MPMLTALLAPFALLLAPVAGDQGVGPGAGEDTRIEALSDDGVDDRWRDILGLSDMRAAPPAQQVRVEGRVILRIAPRPAPMRGDLLGAFASDNDPEPRMVERKAGKCLATREIVGASDRGNRLMLFTRGQRILVADLEKACSARDFYRGFYLERSEDGLMCAGRDRLMSRAGAKCELKALHELVPLDPRR